MAHLKFLILSIVLVISVVVDGNTIDIRNFRGLVAPSASFNDPYKVTYLADNIIRSEENDETIELSSFQNPNLITRGGNQWAVIVAGSNGYYNYRHQADACHAWQILRRNGIPEERIILMMYDDVAFSPENPTPGILINRPNGSDVYQGVSIDYKGDDVTPENFLRILLGDAEGMKGIGSGKVLQSGPNDMVFLNFVDHGAPGLVAFPTAELHARELLHVLSKLYQQRRYNKLVFYLEACESGSMFQNILPTHWNLIAETAANSQESSYACYFDDLRNTYLGDVYSIKWMENADMVDLTRETIQKQFEIVRKETNTSHVMEFGDRNLGRLPVAQFLGSSEIRISHPDVELDPVESVDVPRVILEKKLQKATNPLEIKEIQDKLDRLHRERKIVNTSMMNMISELTGNDISERTRLLKSRFELKNYSCYEKTAKYFTKHCFSIAKNRYVTRKLYILVNMCENGFSSELMIEAMANTCHQIPKFTGIV